MNTSDYLNKIHPQLQDQNTYKPLTHNPKNATAHVAHSLIPYMHF